MPKPDTENTVEEPEPQLDPEEEREAEHRTSVGARVIHEAIRLDGQMELTRSSAALAWSGFAAGLTMGLSLMAEGALRHHLPDADWRPLIVKLGYPLSFLIVIIGKQQLFTENTLTPIIPAMQHPSVRIFANLARLWAVVLAANIAGAHVIAWFISASPVLDPDVNSTLVLIAKEATAMEPWPAFVRAIPSGWLIAMIVWLRAATDSGEIAIIGILSYFIGIGGFAHVIAGSVEYLYLVMLGQANWFSFVSHYFAPVLLGNVIGGVSITAALNHAQVITENNSRKKG